MGNEKLEMRNEILEIRNHELERRALNFVLRNGNWESNENSRD